MASTIKNRVISGVSDNAIQLNNSQFGRLITLPSTWSKVRVGIRVHMTDSGANLTGTPRFALGLGSGVAHMVGSANCVHFVGAIHNCATWTRQVTDYYTVVNGGIWAAKKVGAVITFSASSVNVAASTFGNQAATATADRTIYFVDITKGSPDYTINIFYSNSFTPADSSRETLISQVYNNPTPVVTNHQLGTARTVAVDEAVDGTLNAVQCWWDQSAAVMEISDVVWCLLA